MSDSRAEAFEMWFNPDDGKNYRDCWNAACEWQASRAQPERKLTDAEISDIIMDRTGWKQTGQWLYMKPCVAMNNAIHITDAVNFARALLAAQPAAATVPSEETLRAEFHRQHAGRNLRQHNMRGTYIAANIAALWNQHKRTAEWMATKAAQPAQDDGEKQNIDMSLPEVGSAWIHKNGTEYTVIAVANVHAEKRVEYPTTVVYKNESGQVWSRHLSRWHGSMKAKP